MELLTPIGLTALGIAPFIVALYFLRRRHPPRVVASLQLWSEARIAVLRGRPWERFRPTALLWLQLLALAALALALLRLITLVIGVLLLALVIVLTMILVIACVFVVVIVIAVVVVLLIFSRPPGLHSSSASSSSPIAPLGKRRRPGAAAPPNLEGTRPAQLETGRSRGPQHRNPAPQHPPGAGLSTPSRGRSSYVSEEQATKSSVDDVAAVVQPEGPLRLQTSARGLRRARWCEERGLVIVMRWAWPGERLVAVPHALVLVPRALVSRVGRVANEGVVMVPLGTVVVPDTLAGIVEHARAYVDGSDVLSRGSRARARADSGVRAHHHHNTIRVESHSARFRGGVEDLRDVRPVSRANHISATVQTTVVAPRGSGERTERTSPSTWRTGATLSAGALRGALLTKAAAATKQAERRHIILLLCLSYLARRRWQGAGACGLSLFARTRTS